MARPIKHRIEIGSKFGHLTVLGPAESRTGQRAFMCECECGKTLAIRVSRLAAVKFCSLSCTSLARSRIGDLTGKRYGRWTVLRYAELNERGQGTWLCQCDCGKEKSVVAAQLNNGQSQSCGCLVIDVRTKYRTPDEKLKAVRDNSRRSARKHAARVKAAKIKYETKRDFASPPWLTKAHWDEMDALYAEARRLTAETGIRHEVDHIHPLQGKTVSGLHVPWNLQILTQAENVAKSNRYAELHGDVEK